MSQCAEVDRWKEFVTRGNTEFSLEYYGNAILMYNQALDNARYEFGKTSAISHDRAISQVIISHFNLADCYIAIDQIDRACDYYLQAQNFLWRLTQDTMENEDVYNAINHASSHMNFVWMDFIKKYRDQVGHERMMTFHKSHQAILYRAPESCTCH